MVNCLKCQHLTEKWKCDRLHILRTNDGIIDWFGKPEGDVGTCPDYAEVTCDACSHVAECKNGIGYLCNKYSYHHKFEEMPYGKIGNCCCFNRIFAAKKCAECEYEKPLSSLMCQACVKEGFKSKWTAKVILPKESNPKNCVRCEWYRGYKKDCAKQGQKVLTIDWIHEPEIRGEISVGFYAIHCTAYHDKPTCYCCAKYEIHDGKDYCNGRIPISLENKDLTHGCERDPPQWLDKPTAPNVVTTPKEPVKIDLCKTCSKSMNNNAIGHSKCDAYYGSETKGNVDGIYECKKYQKLTEPVKNCCQCGHYRGKGKICDKASVEWGHGYEITDGIAASKCEKYLEQATCWNCDYGQYKDNKQLMCGFADNECAPKCCHHKPLTAPREIPNKKVPICESCHHFCGFGGPCKDVDHEPSKETIECEIYMKKKEWDQAAYETKCRDVFVPALEQEFGIKFKEKMGGSAYWTADQWVINSWQYKQSIECWRPKHNYSISAMTTAADLIAFFRQYLPKDKIDTTDCTKCQRFVKFQEPVFDSDHICICVPNKGRTTCIKFQPRPCTNDSCADKTACSPCTESTCKECLYFKGQYMACYVNHMDRQDCYHANNLKGKCLHFTWRSCVECAHWTAHTDYCGIKKKSMGPKDQCDQFSRRTAAIKTSGMCYDVHIDKTLPAPTFTSEVHAAHFTFSEPTDTSSYGTAVVMGRALENASMGEVIKVQLDNCIMSTSNGAVTSKDTAMKEEESTQTEIKGSFDGDITCPKCGCFNQSLAKFCCLCGKKIKKPKIKKVKVKKVKPAKVPKVKPAKITTPLQINTALVIPSPIFRELTQAEKDFNLRIEKSPLRITRIHCGECKWFKGDGDLCTKFKKRLDTTQIYDRICDQFTPNGRPCIQCGIYHYNFKCPLCHRR